MRDRIGLAGYCCPSGIGEVNRQLATYCEIDRWLIKPHPKYPAAEPGWMVDPLYCPTGVKCKEFCQSVDIILFVEYPQYGNHLMDEALAQGKRIVCVPMQEWMPEGCRGWPQEVDLFICPTRHCYDQFKDIVKCVHFPWPVDTVRFPPARQWETCESFMFVNGHGGWNGRKGGAVIREAKKLWPEMPLCVVDQNNEDWGNAEVYGACKLNTEVYQHGDVLLCPHHVDGLGLEPMESMASGKPVITTHGLPWNEIPALARIPSVKGRKRVRRIVDWYKPRARDLVKLCQEWRGRDIRAAQEVALKWASSMAWSVHAAAFTALVRGASSATQDHTKN